MPRLLLSPFGKRQPRALVLGLRKIIKDPSASVAERLRACELLAIVEGFVEKPENPRGARRATTSKAPTAPLLIRSNPENANRMRELLEMSRAGS
jgi:hypothetical protein